ncbi:MAG: ribbon-helix-helix domain-containing protein [Magnetospiraceae bacterium]
MAKFSITMSDDLGAFAHTTMADSKFDSVSEYFRHLVRQDYVRKENLQALRNALDAGLESGISELSVDEI